jgi:hypothetical protein
VAASWNRSVVVLVVAFAGIASGTAAGASRAFTVRSTLTGRGVLPHRIHWFASPSLPPAKILEVDFLIDGKLSWVEHHAPYSYGYNANYLVTSWLTPGSHRFTVRAVATNKHVATTTTTARTTPAAAPPGKLSGTWQRQITAKQASHQPSGTWRLTVNAIGWRIVVPPGPGANLIDVGYLAPGLLELRGGIWTKPAPSNNPTEGNGWCDEPFQPAQYHWQVSGNTLTLSLAGPKRCDGQSAIVAGVWKR